MNAVKSVVRPAAGDQLHDQQPDPGTCAALRLARDALRATRGGFEPGELERLLSGVAEGRRDDAFVSP